MTAQQASNPALDKLCVETIRFLSADGVQKAKSGHPGMPMGMAPAAYLLWTKMMKHNPDFELQRKHLEQLRTLKMLEMLDLQEDQDIEFLTSYKNFRQELHELRLKKMDILEKMSNLVKNPDIDDEDLYPVIDEYLRNNEKFKEVHDKFVIKMKTVLTPDQLAKFIIFEERFEAELLERIKDFRHQRMGKQ